MAKIGYIIGCSGQGRILAELWRMQEPAIELHFLDDNNSLHGSEILGVRVDGPVAMLAQADFSRARAVLAVGDNPRRLELAAEWDARGVRWATLKHATAVVMPSAEVGEGTVVFPHALVNTGTRVGRHVIVNSGALIEHDSVVEDGVSISPGVSMGGRVRIARGAFISTGATLAPRITIGAGTIVGAGAVVAGDLPDGVLAYGVPARVMRKLEPGSFSRVL
jgi:acetyltransferase EpsM